MTNDRHWRAVAASVAGSNHVLNGTSPTGCQDRWAVEFLEDAAVIAVADGAGSAKYGGLGAELAVEAACAMAKELLVRAPTSGERWHDLLRTHATETSTKHQEAVDSLRPHLGARSEAFSTTLSVAFLRPPWVGYWAIGDCFVVLRSAFGLISLLAEPHRFGDVESTTHFLSPANVEAASRIQTEVAWLADLDSVAIASDGLWDATVDAHPFEAGRRVPLTSTYAKIFDHAKTTRSLSELHELLVGPFESRSGDDKTIVVCTRNG
ncbi:protein phosphatase 2C domain-containing protein [uncultured Ornithinimicrobium sp.]|uniref:protein phosphatase 2C domain-containing protein n=1 Tax=uncultured Ornithinimicrobium sp. TaxID=259307 RepID=UPI00338FC47C